MRFFKLMETALCTQDNDDKGFNENMIDREI